MSQEPIGTTELNRRVFDLEQELLESKARVVELEAKTKPL